MGIKDRVETAKLLVQHKKYNDALILLLIAVASSARKEFPKSIENYDSRAFKRFFAKRLNEIATDGYSSDEFYDRGIGFDSTGISQTSRTFHSIPEIVYEQYRCSFLHEGELPTEVVFMATSPRTNFKEQTYVQLMASSESPACIVPDDSGTLVINLEQSVNINDSVDNSATVTVMNDNTLVINYRWLDMLIIVIEKARINSDIYEMEPFPIKDGRERIFIISTKTS